MAYAATAEVYLPPAAAPGVLALQRALVWLAGASGAIVFIEPTSRRKIDVFEPLVNGVEQSKTRRGGRRAVKSAMMIART